LKYALREERKKNYIERRQEKEDMCGHEKITPKKEKMQIDKALK